MTNIVEPKIDSDALLPAAQQIAINEKHHELTAYLKEWRQLSAKRYELLDAINKVRNELEAVINYE